jgi:hypothetical protein
MTDRGKELRRNRAIDNFEKIAIGFFLFWIIWGIVLVYAAYHFIYLGYVAPLF